MFGFQKSDQPFIPHPFYPRVSLIKEPRAPKIIMSRLAYARQWLYVDIADQEIGWLGTARRLENGDFYIEDVMLFEQVCSAVETEINTAGLNSLAVELLSLGQQGEDVWNSLRFWGHSHVRMGTSPSGTDENTMVRRGGGFTGGKSRQGDDTKLFCFQDTDLPWAIRGIFNKEGRAEFTIFLYEEGLKVSDAEWTVEDPPAGATVQAGGTGQVESISSEGIEVVEATVVPADEWETSASPADAVLPSVDSGATAQADGGAGSSALSEKAVGRFLKLPIKRPRDRRFIPELAPALRPEVVEEIRLKVTCRYNWFDQLINGGDSSQESAGTSALSDSSSPAAAYYGDGAPMDGEARGPGATTATDAEKRRAPTSPYTYQLPVGKGTARPTSPTAPAVSDPYPGCNCEPCQRRRRRGPATVTVTARAVTNITSEQNSHQPRSDASESFFDWLGRTMFGPRS